MSFVKNQQRIDQPEVFCELCYNNNRYNDIENQSSATFSECPFKKINICTKERHKIECGRPSGDTSDRICRCDSENGYYPFTHPDDHPFDGCSKNLYMCYKGLCGQNERMRLSMFSKYVLKIESDFALIKICIFTIFIRILFYKRCG